MSINPNIENPIIQLCILGTQAEFQGRMNDARALYMQAWQTASNDYEACIAAHYVARFGKNPAETLRWNQVALNHATAVDDERVKDFYPSRQHGPLTRITWQPDRSTKILRNGSNVGASASE